MLGARGFAENIQLPTLLKKSSQGCPGIWRARTEMGMHRVLCPRNTRPLHLSHYCTENSLSSATKEKLQRWVNSGLESASDGIESGASRTCWSSEHPMQCLSPHPSLPATHTERRASSSADTMPARLLGSGAWQQPGVQWCTWPGAARPASAPGYACDVVGTTHLIFLASLWLRELHWPQDSLNLCGFTFT